MSNGITCPECFTYARRPTRGERINAGRVAAALWLLSGVAIGAMLGFSASKAYGQTTLAPEVIYSIEIGDVTPGKPLPADLQEALTLLPKRMRVQVWGLDAYRVDETIGWVAQQTGRSAEPARWPVVLKTGGKFATKTITRDGKTISVAASTADPAGWQDICDRLEYVSARGYLVGLDGESTFTSPKSCPDRWTPPLGVVLSDKRTVRAHLESLPELWVYPSGWNATSKGLSQQWCRTLAPLPNVRMVDEFYPQEQLPAAERVSTSLRQWFADNGNITIQPTVPLFYFIQADAPVPGYGTDFRWGWEPRQWRMACAAYPSDIKIAYPMRHKCVEMAREFAAYYDGWQPPRPPAIPMTEVAP